MVLYHSPSKRSQVSRRQARTEMNLGKAMHIICICCCIVIMYSVGGHA